MDYPQPAITHNGLARIIKRWYDPGDYPSGAGGSPLPACDYVAGIDGKIVLFYPNDVIRWYETEVDESISQYGWGKAVCYDLENMDLLNNLPVERSGDVHDDCNDIRITPTSVNILAVNCDTDGAEVVAEVDDFTECN